jgi:ABC-type transporter Mla subunit MlaD
LADDFPRRSPVSDDDEARMRRSLGIGQASHASGQGSMPRKRFVRDGEVQVEILHARPESATRHAAELAELNDKLLAEREGRQQLERALAEARATIQSLRTHLAHAEMALAERAAQAVAVAPTALPEAKAPETKPPEGKARSAAKPARAKAAKAPAREPKPVKWWTPGFKARSKQR